MRLLLFDWKAFGGGVATLVAAVVTLLNISAIKSLVDQRWWRFSKRTELQEKQVIFAQSQFENQLRSRDDRILKLEAKLEQMMIDIRGLQTSAAEANAKAIIYGQRTSELQTQVDLLRDTVRACSEENDRLQAVIQSLRVTSSQ